MLGFLGCATDVLSMSLCCERHHVMLFSSDAIDKKRAGVLGGLNCGGGLGSAVYRTRVAE